MGDDRARRLALYRLGAERYRDLARLTAAAEPGLSGERLADLLGFAERWEPPDFPIAARDVLALGIPPGPRIGRLLGDLRRWWEDGDFAADRAACLTKLDEIAAS